MSDTTVTVLTAIAGLILMRLILELVRKKNGKGNTFVEQYKAVLTHEQYKVRGKNE